MTGTYVSIESISILVTIILALGTGALALLGWLGSQLYKKVNEENSKRHEQISDVLSTLTSELKVMSEKFESETKAIRQDMSTAASKQAVDDERHRQTTEQILTLQKQMNKAQETMLDLVNRIVKLEEQHHGSVS